MGSPSTMRLLSAYGMEDTNGGRLPSWSYSEREETGSTVSSSSGTIVSTPYTASFSRPSSASMEAAMHFDMLEFDFHGDEDEKQKEDHIKSLVQEFFSSNRSITFIGGGGDMSVLERWLMELGIGWWVLHQADADGAPAAAGDLAENAGSWIQALAQIMRTIRSTASLFPDRGLPGICEGEGEAEPEAERCIPDQFLFALFIQETMLKMLPFVDAIVALDPIPSEVAALQQKMTILLRVRGALSEASSQIRLPSRSAEVARIQGEMVSLFSAKEGKVTQALWGTMEEIWWSIGHDDDSSCTHTSQGSSDIHKVTQTATSHIRFMWDNCWSVTPIVFQAGCLGKYAAEIGGTKHPLAGLTIQMMTCLEEKLGKCSKSFSDQGLGCLFLINNSSHILQQLQGHSTQATTSLHSYITALDHKIGVHIRTYIQVSWAPVLSCLFKHYMISSPLSEFECAFHGTYTAQKMWRVPDPKMKKRLRKAITNKIIPGYAKYIDDNKVTTSRFTPQGLKEMLKDLFEG